ncbi:MAG: proline dehydrogenase [Candidatus Thermofonsia Clade 1 bacterium]|jgi:proline dehydrogenase|uniref:proline dehydrogenase n=1 Tax=Candidatus Thermofonsia Clade 1 bacterium TaxID=2364210 RepID=A0A2M8PG87_9CHLR|nr:MAG: proline dehydrogenase [Candidatus Thermofonsia Clade 1 bacterium]
MLMRSFFLYLARSRTARKILMRLPGAQRVARRFVAGETLAQGIQAVRALNAKGLLATLDHLGENVVTEMDAARATQDYLDLLNAIAESGVNSNVSLKLTQLGLDISFALCLNNMRCILERALEYGNFVRIDMESSAYTEQTLRLYRALRNEHGFRNVGVVIQAYLFRSEADVRALAAEGANIRLCKGAYKEPPHIAFPEKRAVDANFIKLAEYYLSPEARERGAYIGVATHDDNMINAVKTYAAAQGIPKDGFEFQMLYGVRSQAQLALASEGYKVRVYVPYGTEWYPYFMRRLAERPANVWFIMRNFFRN